MLKTITNGDKKTKQVNLTNSINLINMNSKQNNFKNASSHNSQIINSTELPGYNVAFGSKINFKTKHSNHLPFIIEFSTPDGIQFRTITKKDGKPWGALHIPIEKIKIIHLIEENGKKMLGISINNTNAITIEGKSPFVATLTSESSKAVKNSKYFKIFQETFTSTPGAVDEIFQYAIKNSNAPIKSKDMIYVDINELPSVIQALENEECKPTAHLLAALRHLEPNIENSKPINGEYIDKITKTLSELKGKFEPIEKQSEPKVVVDGKFLQAKQFDAPSGKIIYANRPNSTSKGVVSINTVVYDEDSDKLYYVMLKENRPPIQARIGEDSKVLACSAGLVDPNEAGTNALDTYLKAGIRELREETDLNVANLTVLGKDIPSSPECTSENFTSMLAVVKKKGIDNKTNSTKDGIISLKPSNDDGGITDSVNYIPFDKLDEVISKGDFLVNSQTMAGLELMKLKGIDKNTIMNMIK